MIPQEPPSFLSGSTPQVIQHKKKKRHLSLSFSRFLLFSEMLERQEKSEPRDGLVEKGNGRRKNVLIVDEQQPQQQKSGGCCGGGGS